MQQPVAAWGFHCLGLFSLHCKLLLGETVIKLILLKMFSKQLNVFCALEGHSFLVISEIPKKWKLNTIL